MAPDADPRQERLLARERVLEARAQVAEELTTLEASGRAAIDIKARVRQNPAKVAAVIGGVGFLALKGPQRIFRGVRQKVFGAPPPLPEAMLPDEIEKSLRKLGKDGDKIRGTLERDFADYAKKSQKQRDGLRTIILLSALRPLLKKGVETGVGFLVNPDKENFATRLEQVRERLERERTERAERAGEATAADLPPPTGETPR